MHDLQRGAVHASVAGHPAPIWNSPRRMRGREKRGTLLWVLDKTSTAMGKRMLRSWIEQPLLSQQAHQPAPERGGGALCGRPSCAATWPTRCATCARPGAPDDPHGLWLAPPRAEIYALAQTCEHAAGPPAAGNGLRLPEMLAELADGDRPAGGYQGPHLRSRGRPDAPSTLKDGGVIRQGLQHRGGRAARHPRQQQGDLGRSWRPRCEQETGIPKLKIGYNHVFGYYIEVSNSLHRAMVPGDLHPQADPGQRRALHHPGAQGAGKQDPGRPRAADRAGAPACSTSCWRASAPSWTASSARPTPWHSWMCWPPWRRWRRRTTTASPVVDDSDELDHHGGPPPGGGAGAQGQPVCAQRHRAGLRREPHA